MSPVAAEHSLVNVNGRANRLNRDAGGGYSSAGDNALT